VGDQRGVLDDAHAMSNALHVELAQAVPNARSSGGLASVGTAAQSRLRCQAKGGHKRLWAGEGLLVTVEVHANNRHAAVAGRHRLLDPLAGARTRWRQRAHD
jgi:hypothetical protein